jgi:uncharacterized membrane protein
MIRFFSRPFPLAIVLLVASAIPILTAILKVVEIPAGALPEDSLRLAAVPVSMWLHAFAGLVFALLGPLQFTRALQGRFGGLHRLSGRVFVLAGLVLGVSGFSLLAQLDSPSTLLLDLARGGLGAALIVALARGVWAAKAGKLFLHRAWMIRAYAICMGGPSVGLVLFPIFLAGGPVTGFGPDLVFVAWCLTTIVMGEWVITRLQNRQIQS